MSMLLLEVNQEDAAVVENAASEQRIECQVIKTDRIDGTGVDLVNVLVPLTTATLTAVTTIVVQLIRNRRRPKIKWRGVELSDISDKNAQMVLEDLLNKAKK